MGAKQIWLFNTQLSNSIVVKGGASLAFGKLIIIWIQSELLS
jgi:hypothetical protein